MTEEKVIEAVRKFPCLYAVSMESYHDKTAKENAWKSVSGECEVDSGEVKKFGGF